MLTRWKIESRVRDVAPRADDQGEPKAADRRADEPSPALWRAKEMAAKERERRAAAEVEAAQMGVEELYSRSGAMMQLAVAERSRLESSMVVPLFYAAERLDMAAEDGLSALVRAHDAAEERRGTIELHSYRVDVLEHQAAVLEEGCSKAEARLAALQKRHATVRAREARAGQLREELEGKAKKLAQECQAVDRERRQVGATMLALRRELTALR